MYYTDKQKRVRKIASLKRGNPDAILREIYEWEPAITQTEKEYTEVWDELGMIQDGNRQVSQSDHEDLIEYKSELASELDDLYESLSRKIGITVTSRQDLEKVMKQQVSRLD